jgi:hypothetical protein
LREEGKASRSRLSSIKPIVTPVFSGLAVPEVPLMTSQLRHPSKLDFKRIHHRRIFRLASWECRV